MRSLFVAAALVGAIAGPALADPPSARAIVAAYGAFKDMMVKADLGGVRAESELCYRRLGRGPFEWDSADGCIALDTYGALVSSGRRETSTGGVEVYFARKVVEARWAALARQAPGSDDADLTHIAEVRSVSADLLQTAQGMVGRW